MRPEHRPLTFVGLENLAFKIVKIADENPKLVAKAKAAPAHERWFVDRVMERGFGKDPALVALFVSFIIERQILDSDTGSFLPLARAL